MPFGETNTKCLCVYIDSVAAEDTGGGCMVDVVTMRSDNGDTRVLAVTDELVLVYHSLDCYHGECEFGDDCVPNTLTLCHDGEWWTFG